MQQHALSEGLLVAMEEWAAKQPAALPDALEAVERISELLDLSGLFSALLLHPRRDRKSLSFPGGIRVSGLDFGHPCPCGALESYLTKDGCRVMTRDPGDDLWAQTFDWLAPKPSLGADPGRGCAGAGLRREALQRAADALPARRVAADRRCRVHFGGAAAVGQPAPAESDVGGRRVQRSGGMPRGAAYWPPSERMPAREKNDIRNAPRFSPGCSADPQALPWPRAQSPHTAP